jgi:D-3-phosphoglycerate dehydrogenase
MDQAIRRGEWDKPDASSLRDCCLGIIGVGNIGKAVVRRARSFGMRLLGNDPVMVPAEFLAETGLEMVALEILLRESDFVSLHCDLNPTSFHLMDRSAFQLMRPSAFLINTSRGPVINEAELVEALLSKRIAGAALDVFEVEPLPEDSPLRSMHNCLLAPHNSNSDPVVRKRVHESTIANLLQGLRRET